MTERKLLIATFNPGKVREFNEALSRAEVEVHGLRALDDTTPVEETGKTFEANARLKAEGYSLRTDLPVLADDSGLEVDALAGAPGVRSARYGGADLPDRDRYHAVLQQMIGVVPERRTCRFRCVLAAARAGRILATFEGAVEGLVLEQPRGEGGFGYDPVFFHPPTDQTFAEMTTAEKRRYSHRGRAIAAFLQALANGKLRLFAAG